MKPGGRTNSRTFDKMLSLAAAISPVFANTIIQNQRFASGMCHDTWENHGKSHGFQHKA